MSKYKSAPPSLVDVLNALPDVPPGSRMVLRLMSAPGDERRVYSAVEWTIAHPRGHQLCLKRWGATSSASSPLGHISALLVAAQDAYVWFDGKSLDELAKYAAWQLATL